MTELLIDAEQIPTADRNSFILKTFHHLASGESLIIKNSHDPLISLLQSNELKKEDFDHEYLEEGPEVWTLKIRKLSKKGCCGFCGG